MTLETPRFVRSGFAERCSERGDWRRPCRWWRIGIESSGVRAFLHSSYTVGQKIYQQLAPRMARAQMEMGGKNPTIVLADADLELAARLVGIAGFGLTGQRALRPAVSSWNEVLPIRSPKN
jgi:hypothetical protein